MPEIFIGNVRGPRGVQGVQGPKGDSFTFGDFTPEQLESLRGPQGVDGADGATFTPFVSAEGVLSFTNNGGYANPSPVNIKGPQGSPGKDGSDGKDGSNGSNGKDGSDGATFQPQVDANGNLSWSNNKGLANPSTVNIMGPKGSDGAPGKDGVNGVDGSDGKDGQNGRDGVDGATFKPTVSANGDLSWSNDQGLSNPATVNIRGPQGPQGEPGVSPDPSLYLTKEEYAEGFDGGDM